MKTNPFRLNSISKKLLVPTLALVTVLLGVLCTALIVQQNRVLHSMVDSKADGLATMLSKISAPYITNYDLSALDSFVKEATKDRDVAFVEFSDSTGKALTEAVTKQADDKTSSLVYERTIVDSNDKPLGKVKVGYRTSVLDDTLRSSVTLVLGSVAAVLPLLAFGLWMIVRSVARPARRILEGFALLAQGQGDLTARIDVTTNDELGQMVAAFNQTMEKLHALVSEVRDMAETISDGAQQIAAGNQDLSNRTEDQGSRLEETASSMGQLTGTVKQNAENAKQANQLATRASEVAIKGGTAVGQVVATMGSINESSKRIVDIIAVIDGIAFQTNILALNAAVEAARAGEQGRGFAVVASEVRNLAQRSAAAAKEIKALIEDSVGKVDSGARMADEAGKTMDDVVGSIKRVTDIMAEITAASQEQSAGIEQVNQAVAQMDQVTQQNANLVQQAASAADNMQRQAQSLTAAVAVFKLDAHAPVARMPLAIPVALAPPSASEATFERRGSSRTRNVTRLPKRDKATTLAKDGTGGEWTEF